MSNTNYVLTSDKQCVYSSGRNAYKKDHANKINI